MILDPSLQLAIYIPPNKLYITVFNKINFLPLNFMQIENQPSLPGLQITQQVLSELGSVLCSICKREVTVSVLTQGRIGLDDTRAMFDPNEPEVIAVSQRVQGALSGYAIFVVKYGFGVRLLRELLKEDARLRDLTEMEEEALLELGNIVINSYLSSYLNGHGVEINSFLPTLARDHYAQILHEYQPELLSDQLEYLQLQISLAGQGYPVCLFWADTY